MDGRIVPACDANVSLQAPAFTVGCSVFETMANRGAGVIALEQHWQRLVISCAALALDPPTLHAMHAALRELMQANDMREARLRFTVARGEDNTQFMSSAAQPLPVWSATERVVVVPWRRNERSAIAGVKCSSYAENIIAQGYAKERGAGEAIFLNTREELCEGATTNVFIVRENRLLTPPLSSGCLPGVTRALVIDACHIAGLPCEEQVLSLEDFLTADEAFLTSSTRDVHPIAAIDSRSLPVVPGAITARVAATYQTHLRHHNYFSLGQRKE